MKISKSILVASFSLLTSLSFAQFRIDPAGHIGMGTNYPNPGYKCHVKGDLLLTTYPEIPPPNSTFVELKFKVGNGWPGTEIGSNIGKIAFWSSEWGYNSLYAANFYVQSDSSLKTNITPIKNGMDQILKLKPCSYQLKSEVQTQKSSQNKTYGFLAQEVEQVIPDITSTAKGIKLIDYTQIIPLLVDATKEQSKLIDELRNEVQALKDELTYCCAKSSGQSQNATGANSSVTGILYQNNPNPFSEKTTISFQINTNATSASIQVFDMQGTLKKTLPITNAGKGEIIINGHELVAGMYLYSLIVDGKEIDTKRMILNN